MLSIKLERSSAVISPEATREAFWEQILYFFAPLSFLSQVSLRQSIDNEVGLSFQCFSGILHNLHFVLIEGAFDENVAAPTWDRFSISVCSLHFAVRNTNLLKNLDAIWMQSSSSWESTPTILTMLLLETLYCLLIFSQNFVGLCLSAQYHLQPVRPIHSPPFKQHTRPRYRLSI